MTRTPAGDEAPAQLDFYADLLPAAERTRLRALPPGGQALAAEIDALRALLRQVGAQTALTPVERLTAFTRGVDSLGRLYRVRHLLEPGSADNTRALLDRVLRELGLDGARE